MRSFKRLKSAWWLLILVAVCILAGLLSVIWTVEDTNLCQRASYEGTIEFQNRRFCWKRLSNDDILLTTWSSLKIENERP